MFQTKLGAASFPGKPVKPPKPKQQRRQLDLATIVKCSDPYKPERVTQQDKYKELFAGVKEGDCFRCESGGSKELSTLARALRLHMKRNGIEGIVRQSARTDDGIPRVWLLKVFKK